MDRKGVDEGGRKYQVYQPCDMSVLKSDPSIFGTFGTMDQSAKPIFSFVNLSHPDELKDEETQLRIRRLAMSEVGRVRRKPRTKRERNEIILEFRKPAATAATIDWLGGGDVDPFTSFPIDLNETSRALVASSTLRHASLA